MILPISSPYLRLPPKYLWLNFSILLQVQLIFLIYFPIFFIDSIISRLDSRKESKCQQFTWGLLMKSTFGSLLCSFLVLYSPGPCLHPQSDHKPAARSFPGLYSSEVHQSLSLSPASSFPPTKSKFLLVLWYIPHNPYLYLFNPLPISLPTIWVNS